jgi:hypothetical protein
MSSYLDKLKKNLSGVNHAPETSPVELPHGDLNAIDPELGQYPVTEKEAFKSPEKAVLEEVNTLIVPDTDKRFFLSQTLIKAITDKSGDIKNVCPRFIYESYIQKKYREVTKPMMEGIFGETQVLGGGAKGQKVTDLQRHKKTGEKLQAQKNIEEQAIRFKKWCTEKGINVIPGYNTQVPVAKRFQNRVIIRTEIDLFPTPFIDKDGIKLAVMDIKFTADVNSRFGDYCWGAPEFMDHIQADLTYWLLKDFDMELNIKLNPEKEEIYRAIFENDTIRKMIDEEQIFFIYFVIGYRKEPLDEQVKFIHRNYREPNGSLFRQNEWQERARKTLAQLSFWKSQNWPPLTDSHCDKCPVSQRNGGYCDKFQELKTI